MLYGLSAVRHPPMEGGYLVDIIFFPNIFLHSEYERINFDNYNRLSEEFERIWSNALFLGGGYFAPFGSRGGANFTFLYNVLHDNLRSPYGEPYVIRVGFVL